MVLFLYLLISSLHCVTRTNSTCFPRMIFTEKDTIKKQPLPGHNVRILLDEEPDTVMAAGRTSLNSYNFQKVPEIHGEGKVLWNTECNDTSQKECSYNITVVHKEETTNKMFVCKTNDRETLCCVMNLTEQTPTCSPIEKNIQDSVQSFLLNEREPSVFVGSGDTASFYTTYSGSKEYVGIHKFGKDRVRPTIHYKEQYYVGLMLSRRRDDPLQDKVYAFYKEKNKDTGFHSDMWLPYVTQVCMADIGGPKNNLQFTWTSQMYARLFCGDHGRRQHFSELVDVATVYAEQWQDTKIYALFRNEWGMSAVCVYTIKDIDHIFTKTPFKDYGPDTDKDRPRKCVEDSKKIASETLRKIEKTLEMEQWVQPVTNATSLHHNYTHIYVDSSQSKRNSNYIVLFLSLNNGRIHKVMQKKGQTLIIAEYQPFNHQAHILGLTLNPASKKLYVSTKHELVQLDVANCSQYGDTCEDCVLASDPYCGWKDTHCTNEADGTLQDVEGGNHSICSQHGKALKYSTGTHVDKKMDSITLPSQSKYFLQCPVSSHHAQYTWHHDKSSTSCSSKEQNCLLLIDNMGPEQQLLTKREENNKH
uniref:Semaphorin-7A-like n=1 Tax=Mastacembelus armatus TaxID=205130 RepID=A0A3Q3L2L8_9TELE